MALAAPAHGDQPVGTIDSPQEPHPRDQEKFILRGLQVAFVEIKGFNQTPSQILPGDHAKFEHRAPQSPFGVGPAVY